MTNCDSIEKGYEELKYWKRVYESEGGKLSNGHYEYFYTKHFKLDKKYYSGKRILDIGCGPRGSLEWADNSKARIGIDPIANLYMEIGISSHNMIYVNSRAENIPFPDNYFDIITSLNSLDHVDDLNAVISQIKKKLKHGGLFLLLTEVNHNPTPTEPIVLTWDVISFFKPEFDLIEEQHYEKSKNGIYQSIQNGIVYDHNNLEKRYGILSAKFIKL